MSDNFPAVGSFLEQDVCDFRVWAPQRNTCEVKIGENFFPMEKSAQGYFIAKIKGLQPGTEYFYRLDGDTVLPDPASRHQPKGVHGPSAIVDRNFPWSDDKWIGLPLSDMIIYELHVGTFTNEGTFDGVISKLPYLKTLGVNTIEIMPIAQFPGSRNWGYDGVFPFAVQDSYGGVKGFKTLINEAHRQGIAIVLDVVYNHQGPEGNYLGAFGPYFTDKYKTGWGKAINFDDAWCDGVRNFYWQNALMWMDEFHVDGLRLDAVHAIWDFSARHFIGELAAKTKTLEKATGRKKVLIAEFDLNNPRYITPFAKGGLGLDGQWCDEFHHALHSVVTGETDGYYEDFGKIEHLAKAYRDTYVYTGEYSVHRKKHFGVTTEGTTYDQFVVFAQNHDQVGNRMLGDRIVHQLSFEAMKLTAAAYLLSPHVPMLFMGEEYGEKNPFQYFISHGDEKLVDLIRKGRKEEFSYFKWQGEVPDPQAEETFTKCKLTWSVDRDEQSKTLLKFYQHLLTFRKTRAAMKGKERSTLTMLPQTGQCIAFERTFGDDYLLIALNFEKRPATIDINTSFPLRKIFDSSDSEWGGLGERSHNSDRPFELNPEAVVIFEKA